MFENNMKIKKNCTQPHFPVPTYNLLNLNTQRKTNFNYT